MGKVARERTKYHLPAVDPTQPIDIGEEPEDADGKNEVDGLTRGQRRRRERRDRFLKKLDFASYVQNMQQQSTLKKTKKPLGDLSSLTTSLSDLNAEFEKAKQEKQKKLQPKGLSQKRKQHILLREVQQFQSVLSHPVFQSNPFGAIREHLNNTLQATSAPSTIRKAKR
eukprot:GILK01006324.1.p1 GENE.GILK01006324.1~~GILK01006324.1.p1  ORF type:complete len:169 (-),score=32.43 GILK01006324.1:615-1121(-)